MFSKLVRIARISVVLALIMIWFSSCVRTEIGEPSDFVLKRP